MSCVRRKDLADCAARAKLKLSIRPHYYDLFLWEHVEALKACLDDVERVDLELEKERGGEPTAFCCHSVWHEYEEDDVWKEKWPRKLGEIHFLKGKWDLEVVSHECEHAKTHICRRLHINPLNAIDEEEQAAYILGEMVQATYRWLWKVDKDGKYATAGEKICL